MTIIFVRHGACKRNENDPGLTSFGKRIAQETGHWLVSLGLIPDKFISTATLRTRQTAVALMVGTKKFTVEISDIPINRTEWGPFIETLHQSSHKCIAIVGHHPTIELLNEEFDLSIPTANYASAVVIQKTAVDRWVCFDSWQGRPDYG